MFMEMFNSWKDFLHEPCSSTLTEPLVLYNFIEKLAPGSQLHDDMNVPIIYVTFVKLYDVGVVYLSKNFEFFFQQFDIFFYVLSQNTFNSVFDIRIWYSIS